MPRITEKGRYRQHRGEGTGANYKPWIKIRDFGSQGAASNVIDYKHGRTMQLLSQGEVYYYYLLRWRDDVEDIREQFPLDLADTVDIANRLEIMHPKDDKTRMTTDLLVTKTNGQLEAYNIKTNKSELDNPRTAEKIYIEKLYWESRGVPFFIKFKDDVNKILVQNIIDVVSCYDIKNVHTIQDDIRFRIAHKEISLNLEAGPIDYKKIERLLLAKGENND